MSPLDLKILEIFIEAFLLFCIVLLMHTRNQNLRFKLKGANRRIRVLSAKAKTHKEGCKYWMTRAETAEQNCQELQKRLEDVSRDKDYFYKKGMEHIATAGRLRIFISNLINKHRIVGNCKGCGHWFYQPTEQLKNHFIYQSCS
jgi:hypothetical protein